MSKILSQILTGTLLFQTFFFATGDSAFAYLAGGTASFVFQMLGASLFASLFGIKLFWQRIVTASKSAIHKIRAIKNVGE